MPGHQTAPAPLETDDGLRIHEVRARNQYPAILKEDQLVAFLFEHLKPYNDTLEDIRRGVQDAFGDFNGKQGFVLIAEREGQPAGALVMLATGMQGYIPPYIILFVAVHQDQRGQGIGGTLCRHALQVVDGDVKLHVEHDNPAKRLYERLGFNGENYAEMRYKKS